MLCSPSLKPTDLVDLGVSPGACLAILGPSAGKAKKIEASAEAILHDVATHQSVLEDELRHHRAEIERLRISRDELPEDLCCPITCELMKDPVITADGTTFERCAIKEWFETGARTSPTTNEPSSRTSRSYRTTCASDSSPRSSRNAGACPLSSLLAAPLLTKMKHKACGAISSARRSLYRAKRDGQCRPTKSARPRAARRSPRIRHAEPTPKGGRSRRERERSYGEASRRAAGLGAFEMRVKICSSTSLSGVVSVPRATFVVVTGRRRRGLGVREELAMIKLN